MPDFVKAEVKGTAYPVRDWIQSYNDAVVDDPELVMRFKQTVDFYTTARSFADAIRNQTKDTTEYLALTTNPSKDEVRVTFKKKDAKNA